MKKREYKRKMNKKTIEKNKKNKKKENKNKGRIERKMLECCL